MDTEHEIKRLRWEMNERFGPSARMRQEATETQKRWRAERAQKEAEAQLERKLEKVRAEAIAEAKNQVLAELQLAGRVQLQKPDPDALIDRWFDYYHACKAAKIKYTLKELAQDVNLTEEHIRDLHERYKTMQHKLRIEYRARLHQNMVETFDEEELKTLCFQMGIEYDDLRGEGKEAKAKELITYLERRGHIPELVTRVQKLRPDISWDAQYSAAKDE